ncbi:alpha/beta fold hydrolase [Paenibacillus sp. NPDC058071]|uniref:alpha/beta fold hydrolase n=1 Tax=Paenibacillus sp. NPDC058071 TaxID=3346326 RepID=UPI0036DEC8D9
MQNPSQPLTIELKDKRKLAYTEYGAADGFPVFIFHGTPGSRLWFTEDDETAASLQIRLISTDRPGFGASDRLPGRRVLDWPSDVAALADALGLERFAVLGVSGGGVYAAACAYVIPERLTSATMVSSAAPFPGGKPPKSMSAANRFAFTLSKRVPWLLRLSYNAQKKMIEQSPDKFLRSLRGGNGHLTDWDRQFMQTDEHFSEFMMHLGEALRQGPEEAASEPGLLSQDWGFDPAAITIPVLIWHGEADRMAPFDEIRKLAARMPTSRLQTHKEAGHFLSSDEASWKEILQAIIQKPS